MCGIVGKLNFESEKTVSRDEIGAMLGPILHRGPDGQGIHLDGPAGLGHCRLSIIDLSTGDQPMTNEDKTIWVVFNGEIYNFETLRDQLVARGHVFHSRSDTEVIVHAYEEFGPECVNKFKGMFAFALWDASRRRLLVARDRVGIKPLYYAHLRDTLLFASEFKAIMTDSSAPRDIDHGAIRQFTSFNYIPGEKTLFRHVRKLLPGHYLVAENGKVTIRRYWDLEFTDARAAISLEEATEELRALLADTVRSHMIADVPVGVLLSGGVDSSAVLSFAVEGTRKKVSTFTVGFDGGQVVDERPYARLTARRFGTEHHDISITPRDFWDFLPTYVRHMEEPVCEPPAVALYYVSRLARDHVKVLLSGEGGDEAFAGYPNYPGMLRLERWRSRLGVLARPVGEAAALAGRLIGDGRVEKYGAALGRPLSSQYFSRTSGPASFFNRNAARFCSPDFLARTAADAPEDFVRPLFAKVSDQSLLNQMLFLDTMTWLPDDLLVKADKITMANSLELRVPLLDHTVLEFAASLPDEVKVKGRETKRVLKSAFAKVLPEEILRRRKAGFPVPYEQWLCRDFKAQLAEIMLSPGALSRGYFRRQEMENLLRVNARSGRYAKEVFSLLVLELWHRQFLDSAAHE
jgi:asparagine synthase (glutamine-hydrolysing)